ncbi:MAG: hypothetical protein ACLSAP_02045 [Oscillospiraceae bacterium]
MRRALCALPPVLESGQASRYLGAVERLSADQTGRIAFACGEVEETQPECKRLDTRKQGGVSKL